MTTNMYRNAIAIYSKDGTCIGKVPVTVNYDAAIEWTWFRALRGNRIEATDDTHASEIGPLWHSRIGEPYLDGFRVTISPESGEEYHEDFTIDYFEELTQAISTQLQKKDLMKEGEIFLYFVMAYPDRERDEQPAGPKLSFTTEAVAPPLPIKESSLNVFTNASSLIAQLHSDDMPVFIPRRILEETKKLSREAGAKEVGGILIGHLHRDLGVPEVFVEITGQLPAEHTVAELHSLTFTPETWTAAQAALDRRGNGEIYLGWHHSHPIGQWCKKCKKKEKNACPLNGNFFSEHDRQFQRTVFPRNYTVALVVTDISRENVTHSLFGWRRGRMERRGYYILGQDRLHSDKAEQSSSEKSPARSVNAKTVNVRTVNARTANAKPAK